MITVFLGLGSNIGERYKNLTNAIQTINNRIGPVADQSDFIETEPWGYESKNLYINAVIRVDTDLSPIDLLHKTQEIEREMGRLSKTVGGEYHDRVVDIDILLYGELKMKTDELIIPHPRMKERDFVMIPLQQLMERDHTHCLPKDDNEEFV